MYFEIGRQIVQEDQMGKIRADYAKSILGQLSKRLTEEFGRGYSVDNLENCRRFYLAYEMRISETVSRKSETRLQYWVHLFCLAGLITCS